MAKKKRTSLDSILPPVKADKPAADASRETTDETSAKSKPTRKQLAVLLDLPVYQQLRTIAFEEETKMHPLLIEGLDRVFADRGLPSVADLTAAPTD